MNKEKVLYASFDFFNLKTCPSLFINFKIEIENMESKKKYISSPA